MMSYQGPSGALDIVDIMKFCSSIKRELTDYRNIQIPKMSKLNNTVSLDPLSIPNTITATSIVVEVNKEFFTDREELWEYGSPNEDNIILKGIKRELVHELMQKKLDFQYDNVGIEQLDKMSMKYAKEFGGNGCIVEFRLNAYQKYIAVMDHTDFKFYHTEVQRMENADMYTLRGRLVVLRPEKWITASFNEATYIQEFAANMRYI